MKHGAITFIFVGLAAFVVTGCRNYDAPGSGPLILTPQAQERFDTYLVDSHPDTFILSIDGQYAAALTCPSTRCSFSGDVGRWIRQCEKKADIRCAVFAKGRTIVWNGEITRLKRLPD